MTCNRCGHRFTKAEKTNRAYVVSAHTGRRYCANMGLCDRRLARRPKAEA